MNPTNRAAQIAMKLHVPIPTIDLAVATRDLSAFANQRERLGALLQRPMQGFGGDRDGFFIQLYRVLHIGMFPT
jgi:6-phosphogluconate dehydrogenase